MNKAIIESFHLWLKCLTMALHSSTTYTTFLFGNFTTFPRPSRWTIVLRLGSETLDLRIVAIAKKSGSQMPARRSVVEIHIFTRKPLVTFSYIK